jgi:hypothetical protein
MTEAEKIAAYDYTLYMLEATCKAMDNMDRGGNLTEYGKGDLWRIKDTIRFLKGYTFESNGEQ